MRRAMSAIIQTEENTRPRQEGTLSFENILAGLSSANLLGGGLQPGAQIQVNQFSQGAFPALTGL